MGDVWDVRVQGDRRMEITCPDLFQFDSNILNI